MKSILVSAPFEESGKLRLSASAPDYDIVYGYNDDAMKHCDAYIGNPPVDKLPIAENLKWVQLQMAGTEPYSRPGVLPNGVTLTNSSGAFGLAISEHMVACVTMLYKKLHLYRDNMKSGVWLDRGNVKKIEGSTVLVVGMGDIGGQFAQKMKALGCYIIGVKRTESDKPDWCDELYTQSALDSLLPRADIVALSLPNTPDTRGIMNRERLFALKKGATLLNVGRGNAIDTDALCDALDCGQLYAASLDVTDPEPLPPDHRLWSCENALVTPHISGFFHLRDTYDSIIDIAVENTARFVRGEQLLNIVDLKTGYRYSQ